MNKLLLSAIISTFIFATDTTQVTIADLKEATFLIIKDLKNTSKKLEEITTRLDRVESNTNISNIKASIENLRSDYVNNSRLISKLQSDSLKQNTAALSLRHETYVKPKIETYVKPKYEAYIEPKVETYKKDISFNNTNFESTNNSLKTKYNTPLSISYDENSNFNTNSESIDYTNNIRHAPTTKNNNLSISYNKNSTVPAERTSKYDDEILEFIESNGY